MLFAISQVRHTSLPPSTAPCLQRLDWVRACSRPQCLFFYSFVALRIQRPIVARPFRLPGGVGAAIAYCVPPLLLVVAAFVANTLGSLVNTLSAQPP